ncbi:amidohydrolase family protein [bacterium]|nr:amidohydrolase family protein [bacterium]
MRVALAGLLALLGASGTGPERVLAIVGVEAWVGVEEAWSPEPLLARVPNATILIRGGVIVSVVTGGAVPEGAQVVDGHGMVATAALFEMGTSMGIASLGGDLDEIGDAGHLHSEETAHGDGMPPVARGFARHETENMDPAASHVKLARTGGIGLALVRGTGWAGLASLAPPKEGPGYARVLRDEVALSLPWAGGAAGRDQWETWREDLLLLERAGDAYDQGALRTLSMPPDDLRAVGRALRGEVPAIVAVDDAHEILRVLDLADDWGMRVILQGAAEGWVVAERVASSAVGVLLDSESNLPGSWDLLGARLDNAALLAAAGVPVALSSFWTHNARRLRHKAGVAWSHGLPEALAWAAVTEVPAALLGLERLGRLEPGWPANIALWEGHPMDFSGRLRGLWIAGERVGLVTRQDILFERYRTLSPGSA